MKQELLRKKILGGWLGKSIGGTLGQPGEGCAGPLNLTYYDPVPTKMLPNDDLDLQILSAWALRQCEVPKIDRNFFARLWMEHVRFPYDEYAIALKNFQRSVFPPESGKFDNYFTDGLGAAIRSELWAALAAGNPGLAAQYAYEDACLDHDGDGIYAAEFLAALESAAFTGNDLNQLLDAGLAVIPADCRFAQMVRDVRQCAQTGMAPLAIRDHIKLNWGSDNFTDSVMNLGFSIMALLCGKGDFGKSICLAVNCGRDTDCTGATVGAILGILDPDGIPEKWLAPIGGDCVVSDPIINITPPATLDELADWVLEIRAKLPEFEAGTQQPFEHAPITAECRLFTPWIADDDRKCEAALLAPAPTLTREFPGIKAAIGAKEVPHDSIYLMNYRFHLAHDRKVLVMFNSRENTRVWVDGKFCFGREGGRMAPSFHRAPVSQRADLFLKAGDHEMLCGIAPCSGAENLEWVMGIADAETKLFLPPDELSWR